MGSSSKMKYVFKVAMMIEFKMKDLGLMKYFLGMEVYQGKKINYFSRKVCKGYVEDVWYG